MDKFLDQKRLFRGVQLSFPKHVTLLIWRIGRFGCGFRSPSLLFCLSENLDLNFGILLLFPGDPHQGPPGGSEGVCGEEEAKLQGRIKKKEVITASNELYNIIDDEGTLNDYNSSSDV